MTGITPIGGVSGASGIGAVLGPSTTSPVNPGSAADFGSVLSSTLQNVQGLQTNADQLALQAVTGGDLSSLHQATIAATRAQVAMETVSTLRNKGIEAFNEIMRMQA